MLSLLRKIRRFWVASMCLFIMSVFSVLAYRLGGHAKTTSNILNRCEDKSPVICGSLVGFEYHYWSADKIFIGLMAVLFVLFFIEKIRAIAVSVFLILFSWLMCVQFAYALVRFSLWKYLEFRWAADGLEGVRHECMQSDKNQCEFLMGWFLDFNRTGLVAWVGVWVLLAFAVFVIIALLVKYGTFKK